MNNCHHEDVSKELTYTFEQWAKSAFIDLEKLKEKLIGLSPDDDRVISWVLDKSLVDCFVDRVSKAWDVKENPEQVSKFKSDLKAKDYRLKGNSYYKEKQFDQAHYFYTQAIRHAIPEKVISPQDNEFFLAYSNRSAVNYHSQRWQQAIGDIEMAIKYGLSRPELLQRKVKCEQKIADESENGQEESSENLLQAFNSFKLEDEPIVATINPKLPASSIKVSMMVDEKKGRGLKAIQAVKFGEILVKDDPYSHSLFVDCYDDYCQTCCQPLDGFSVPCVSCSIVQYCSLNCRKADIVHSKYSCHPQLPHIFDPLIQLVLRIMIRSFLPQEKQNEPENGSDQIYLSNYESFQKLCYSPTISTDFILPSIYLGVLIQKMINNANKTVKPSLETLIPTIFLHLHRLLINKAFLETHVNFVQFSASASPEDRREKIGLAVYPTMSLINHSCQPNVFLFFNGPKAIIRASRNLEPGQELFLCYGPSYASDTLSDRRSKLREFYYFDCECLACSQSLECPQICFKCTRCQGPLIVNDDDSNHCLSCKASGIFESGIKRLIFASISDMNKGRQSYESGDFDAAVQILSKCYNTMDDHLFRSNRNLLSARSYLYDCLASMGHYEMASKLCVVNVNVTRETYGSESVDYVIIMITYLGLIYKDLEDIVVEDKEKAKQKVDQILNLIDEQIERLTRLGKLADSSNDPRKVFQQEMASLDGIKEQCQRISKYLTSEKT